MDLSPLIPIAPGAAVAAVYWRRRRAGGDPLGPRPTGCLPDTTVALATAALLALGIRAVLPSLVADTDLTGYGGYSGQLVLAGSANVAVALVTLRAATGGTRRPVLPAWKLVAAGVLGAVVVVAAEHVVGIVIQQAYALDGQPVPGQQVVVEAQAARGPDVVAAAVGAVLMAPFGEEVFFRGLLLPVLVRFRGERAGLALQAVLFGAMHLVGAWHTWPLAIPLAIVGWSAGWLYLRTGSLAVPIVLHATFNAINFAAIRAMG